jgi:hypothetical protein
MDSPHYGVSTDLRGKGLGEGVLGRVGTVVEHVFRNHFRLVRGGQRFQLGWKLGLGPMAIGEFGQSQLDLTN